MTEVKIVEYYPKQHFDKDRTERVLAELIEKGFRIVSVVTVPDICVQYTLVKVESNIGLFEVGKP